ncbi:helix-turn-helix domain-containing protein [Hydrogenimonas sp.]
MTHEEAKKDIEKLISELDRYTKIEDRTALIYQLWDKLRISGLVDDNDPRVNTKNWDSDAEGMLEVMKDLLKSRPKVEGPTMTPDELKRKLKEIGVSQKEFAERTGVSRESVSNWATGKYEVPKWVNEMIELMRVEKKFNKIKELISDELEK